MTRGHTFRELCAARDALRIAAERHGQVLSDREFRALAKIVARLETSATEIETGVGEILGVRS